jgi:hypothetical protein
MQPAHCFCLGSAFFGRCGVALAFISTLGALYGLSVASDPQTYLPEPTAQAADQLPGEDDYRQVPDPSHNLRIFALREALDERGFMLDGDRALDCDPLAAIRGTYGLHSPSENGFPLEWRLMASRAPTCQPTSMLRLHEQDRFSPQMVAELVAEWRFSACVLPAEVIAAGEGLLAQLVQRWEATAPQAASRQESFLELTQRAGDYGLIAELIERPASDDAPPSCEIALQFTWLK